MFPWLGPALTEINIPSAQRIARLLPKNIMAREIPGPAMNAVAMAEFIS